MAFPDITRLVPHAKPMLLLDRILAADEETLSAELKICPDSLFCRNGKVGAWVGLEYMAQTVAAHAGYLAHMKNEPVRPGMLLGTRRYHSGIPCFTAGSILQIHAKCLFRAENGLGAYECTIAKSEKELAKGILTLFQPDNLQNFLKGNGA